jgi:hypothetical protein
MPIDLNWCFFKVFICDSINLHCQHLCVIHVDISFTIACAYVEEGRRGRGEGVHVCDNFKSKLSDFRVPTLCFNMLFLNTFTLNVNMIL